MISFAEVIFCRVKDNRTTDDAAWAKECNDIIGVRGWHDATFSCQYIAQITDVTNWVLTSAVFQFVRVVMSTSAPGVREIQARISFYRIPLKYLHTSTG